MAPRYGLTPGPRNERREHRWRCDPVAGIAGKRVLCQMHRRYTQIDERCESWVVTLAYLRQMVRVKDRQDLWAFADMVNGARRNKFHGTWRSFALHGKIVHRVGSEQFFDTLWFVFFFSSWQIPRVQHPITRSAKLACTRCWCKAPTSRVDRFRSEILL